jgi:membrane protease YdiL (CAAX protease family)
MKKFFLQQIRNSNQNQVLVYCLWAVSIFVLGKIIFSGTYSVFQGSAPENLVFWVGFGTAVCFVLPMLWKGIYKRSWYDPGLNRIKINGIKNMRPYTRGQLFFIDTSYRAPSAHMYLSCPDYMYNQPLFISLTISDVDFFEWAKNLKKIDNQQLRAINFFEEDGKILYKFWTLKSSEELVFSV